MPMTETAASLLAAIFKNSTALLFFADAVYPAIISPPSLTPVFIHWTGSVVMARGLSRLRAALNVSDCCVIAWLYNFHPHAVSFICPGGLITITAIWLMLSFCCFYSPLKRLSLCIYPYPKHLIFSTKLSSQHRQVLIQEIVVPEIIWPQTGSLRLCCDCVYEGDSLWKTVTNCRLAGRCPANPKPS